MSYCGGTFAWRCWRICGELIWSELGDQQDCFRTCHGENRSVELESVDRLGDLEVSLCQVNLLFSGEARVSPPIYREFEGSCSRQRDYIYIAALEGRREQPPKSPTIT